MKSFTYFLLVLIILFFIQSSLTACKPSVSYSDEVAFSSVRTASKDLLFSSGVSNINEFGLLINVEDSGYPFYTLTIEFPERGFTEYFVINLEEVQSVDLQTLSNSVGKYLAFEYTSEIINSLLDLEVDGASIFNQNDVVERSSDIQVIEGILSNAETETTGDLPGELYITTEEEITLSFPFYITSEIVDANGKMVIGYYDQRTLNTIISLEIKE